MEFKKISDKYSTSLAQWLKGQTGFGIIITDLEFNIVFLNNWFKDYYGDKTFSFVNKSLFELFPEIQKRNLDKYYKSSASGSVNYLAPRLHKYLLEIELAYNDGTTRLMTQSALISPLYDNSKIIGILTRIDDVTERIVKEDTLRKNIAELLVVKQDLEKTNSEKDKLFRIIAHDLRSPFNVLLNQAEYLNDEGSELTNDEIMENVRVLNSLIKNQYKLLSNLLEWSQLQTGAIKFSPQNINLSSTIKNVLEIVTPTAKEKNIELKINLNHDISINADNDMLESLFRNLLTNGIKFTNRNGLITIDVSNSDSFVKINISDNGVGMDETTLNGLFRSDDINSSIGTNGERGTGLGLAICNDFVKKHNGKLSAKSKLGEGTTFTIELPLAQN